MRRAADPILVEVLKHELAAIAEQMAIAISRTGRSAMMKSGDFAVAIADAEGKIVGPGYASPMQLVAFSETMEGILAVWRGRLGAGDAILVNDPYAGMGHMPDVAVATPIFWRGELVAFMIAYSHHTDIGGRFPGGMSSQATSSFEEGLRIPPVRLIRSGVRDDDMLTVLLANIRTPEEFLGDVEAKLAGCRRGESELCAVLDRHGLAAFQDCGAYLLSYSEQATREAIAAIPDGVYAHEEIFEDDGFGNPAAIRLKVTLTVAGDEMRVDYAGTDPQAPSAINMPLSMTKGMTFAALKLIVGPDVLLNAGFLAPFDLVVPKGSVLNPNHPAAVGGRAPVMFRVSEVVTRALAKALPERIPIPGEGADIMHYTGVREDGRPFTALDVYFGGWGGRPNKDGIDGATPVMFGSYGTLSAEALERELPIVVEGFGFVPDTSGAGQRRGSLGIYRQWRFLRPGHVMIRTNRPTKPSGGLAEGEAGALSRNILWSEGKEIPLPRQTHLHFDVKAGDRLYHMIGGSGGFGDPRARSPEEVRIDVAEEKLSVESARMDFGVVIDHGEVDRAATDALRG